VIAYLVVDLYEPQGYLGGLLVADEFGLPVEFRHTLPVRPTKLQRAIYGDALDRYVRSVVVAQRLVAAMEHRPAIVLVGDPMLLSEADTPLGHLSEGGVDPVGPAGHLESFSGAQSGFLIQLRRGEAPLRLVTKAPAHVYPELGRALVVAAETMDLQEPMARVRAGLGMIAHGDVAAA
jgi:hypothetical protein